MNLAANVNNEYFGSFLIVRNTRRVNCKSMDCKKDYEYASYDR